MITISPSQILEHQIRERFTDRARTIIGFARQEAQRVPDAQQFGTEHILLALVREGNSTAAQTLKNAGATYTNLQEEDPQKPPAETIRLVMGIPPTDAAQKAIDYAIAEAKNLGDEYISAEHLFLGLIHDPDHPATQRLLNLGLNLDHLRHPVLTYAKTGLGDFGDPTGRFTERAKKTMVLANTEALRLCHDLGSEHILLGLIAVGSGVCAHIFKNFQVDLPKARLELEKLIKPAPGQRFGRVPLTPQAHKVIEYAKIESQKLRHNYLGTDHLLLGILHESDGMAAQLLIALGLTLDQIKSEVLKNMYQFRRDATDWPKHHTWLTPSIRRILELAEIEADERGRGHHGPSPDDLLLALLLHPLTGPMLNDHGLDYYTIREEIRRHRG